MAITRICRVVQILPISSSLMTPGVLEIYPTFYSRSAEGIAPFMRQSSLIFQKLHHSIKSSSSLLEDPGYHHIIFKNSNIHIIAHNSGMYKSSIGILMFHPSKQSPQSPTTRSEPYSIALFLLRQCPLVSPPLITLRLRLTRCNALLDGRIQSGRVIAIRRSDKQSQHILNHDRNLSVIRWRRSRCCER